MGLDMYLLEKTNKDVVVPKKGLAIFGHWRVLPSNVILFGGNGETPLNNENDFKVIYQWRKEKPIHDWFIENIQKGKNNQKIYSVSYDDLMRLKNELEYTLENPGEIIPPPPTQSELDEFESYYSEHVIPIIKETIKVLNELDPTKEYCYDSWF